MMMMKWKKRSLFLLVTAVAISGAVAACVFFIPPLRKRIEKREKPTFTTTGKPPSRRLSSSRTCEDCTVVGARMIKLMDKTADPCEDFYGYACGNFGEHHSNPENWESYDWKDVYSKKLDLAIKSILEESDAPQRNDSLSKARIVYRTCTDTYEIDKHSVFDLRDVLSNTGVGEWPFLKPGWKDCRLDVEWRMAKLNAMGLDSLFRLDVRYGDKEPNKLHAVLRPAEPLVRDICDDPIPDNISEVMDERVSEHRDVLLAVLRLLDVNVNNVTEQDIADLFEFDFLFCNATKESRKRGAVQDPSSLNMTLSDFASMSPQINWLRWQDLIFSELNLGFPHNRQYIFVDGMEFAIDGINRLLQTTSSKVQANYLTWRFVLNHLGFLGKEFRQILELHAHLLSAALKPLQTGPDRWIQERWRQCVLLVKNLMPLALVRPYSDHIRMESRKREMENVISMITDQFKNIMFLYKDLNALEQRKSNQMIDIIRHRSFITYPYKEERFFSDFYMDAGIRNDSFLKNGLNLRHRRTKKLLEGTFHEKKADDMEYSIQTIYSPFGPDVYSFFRGKQIVISLGALQYCPVQGVPLPKFVTLSTFGWMYGHELAHGFDLKALDGTTGRNWTWWRPQVFKDAKERTVCHLHHHPSTYNMSVEEALETTTLNEDLVDQQALLLAHRAYEKYLKESKDEQTLPNIRLTNKELFFVSYAQQFCESRRTVAASPSSAGNSDGRGLDGHSATSEGRRRVNEVLRNYVPFSTTFRCGREKSMNRPTCPILWT